MKINRKKIFGLIVIILLVCSGVYFYNRYMYSSDVYVYVPYNVRAAPKYTDVKMFECAWCHRTKNLNRHHIIPQSANPALKNDYSNIVILCRDCHFVLGHRCNWKKFNPDVMVIVETYTNSIVSAKYLENLNDEQYMEKTNEQYDDCRR